MLSTFITKVGTFLGIQAALLAGASALYIHNHEVAANQNYFQQPMTSMSC